MLFSIQTFCVYLCWEGDIKRRLKVGFHRLFSSVDFFLDIFRHFDYSLLIRPLVLMSPRIYY